MGSAARAPDVAVHELRELAGRVAPVVLAGEQVLPAGDAVAALLPRGSIRRGSVVTVEGPPGSGATSLVLHLVSAASRDGSWVAIVGLPSLGVVAAAEAGVDLARLALVPTPGGNWPLVAAALLDAIDVVVLRPATRVRAQDARRLASRARERGSVLVVAGQWPERADVRLAAEGSRWAGLGDGHGFLREREVTVTTSGRGSASRTARKRVAM